MNWRNIVIAILAATGLGGCAGTVVVTDQFPIPVVEPLPYRVGYLLDEQFRTFVYQDDDSKVNFELGPQQSALYTRAFSSIFDEAIALNELTSPDAEIDFLLQPKLIEYAFLSPDDTASKFFAASMKYQVRIHAADGKLLGYWPLVAYGKSRTKFMNRNESLGEATSLALRDAAAGLVTRFRQALEKEQWRAPEQVAN